MMAPPDESTLQETPAQTLLAATIPDALSIRDELQDMVVRNLLGPEKGPEEEVDDASISEHYLCGMIAPRRRKFFRAEVAADALGSGEKGSEEGPIEPAEPQAMTMFPSSFGLTFTLPLSIETIEVRARWGHYSKIKSDGILTKTGEPKSVWKRRPVEARHTLRLQQGELPHWHPDPQTMPDVRVQGRARRRDHEWIVSLFLVNDSHEPDINADSAWLFQAQLHLSLRDGGTFQQHRITLDGDKVDEEAWGERRQLAMLYRKSVEFAVGHNVSVHATRDPQNGCCALSLETTALPHAEVERQDPPPLEAVPGLHHLVLNMDALAVLPREALVTALRPLEAAYGA